MSDLGRPSALEALMVVPAFWERDDDLAPLSAPGQPRVREVALAEFSVELVTHTWRAPLPGAALFDPTMFTDVGILVQLLGLGRRLARFDEGLQGALPDRLCAAFAEGLGTRGVAVRPVAEVRACRTYDGYEAAARGSSSLARLLNPVGHDTGRIRSFEVLPATGLPVIEGAAGGQTLEEVDAALLGETGADMVVRVRLRVGVYEGRASVERGSEVHVTHAAGRGRVTSGRSITSDEEVAVAGFLPVRGIAYEVDGAAYLAAMDALFPVYRELALDALGLPKRPAAATSGEEVER
ncbi:MAG: hypothetical protein KF878_16570 [Planctomycetes bacterium]|nr:hypothetical protein [Planctomycetota bacterium]